jgi:hypothetical protein
MRVIAHALCNIHATVCRLLRARATQPTKRTQRKRLYVGGAGACSRAELSEMRRRLSRSSNKHFRAHVARLENQNGCYAPRVMR